MEAIVKKFQKMGTAQLIAKMSKLVGEEREAVIGLLEKRNQDVSEWTGTAVVKNVVEFEDTDAPLTKSEQAQIDAAEKELDAAEKTPEIKEVTKKVKKVKTEKKESVSRKKDAPKPGSVSEKILVLLQKGELSKYAIAKELNTYYSVVQSVAKHYLTTPVS